MLNTQERAGDREEAFRRMMEGHQSSLWTALPGRITAVNRGLSTVSVQPSIQAAITAPDGTVSQQNMPMLADVPIIFPGGGGATMTFPVNAGDECLVIFSSRPIDTWWQSGGEQPQVMPRMHSLSDGFALVGLRGSQRALPGVSGDSVSMRSDSGAYHVTLQPASGKVTVVGQEVEVTAPKSKFNGDVEITGELKVAGIIINTHKHSGIVRGGALTDGPQN